MTAPEDTLDEHEAVEAEFSDYLDKRGTSSQCFYETLPLVDGFRWSTLETIAGLRLMSDGGGEVKGGTPIVDDSVAGELVVRWPTESPKGELVLKFNEASVSISATGELKDKWFFELSSDEEAELPFAKIDRKKLSCTFKETPYSIVATSGSFTLSDGSGLRITPEKNSLVLDLSSR